MNLQARSVWCRVCFIIIFALAGVVGAAYYVYTEMSSDGPHVMLSKFPTHASRMASQTVRLLSDVTDEKGTGWPSGSWKYDWHTTGRERHTGDGSACTSAAGPIAGRSRRSVVCFWAQAGRGGMSSLG